MLQNICNDNYKDIGIVNPNDECLNIENQINDSIKPRPDYTLKINDNKTISLFVKQGKSTPYKYNGKVYKRSDSSTVEVDEIEEKRLFLSGMNISFEKMNVVYISIKSVFDPKDYRTFYCFYLISNL